MKRLLIFLLALFFCGCELSPPDRFTAVCGQSFGKISYDRELMLIPLQFVSQRDLLEVSVTPLSHLVWRIAVVMPEFPGDQELIAAAGKLAKEEFRLNFDKSGKVDLPGTSVQLVPAYEYGPRAVRISFVDKEYEKIFLAENSSPEVAGLRKKRQAKSDILLLEKIIGEYKRETGVFPRKLADLQTPPPGIENWHGPYWLNSAEIPADPWGREYCYRVRGERFELFSSGESGCEVLR